MVRRNRQAFTLVEILIVIGIILLLITIGVIGFQHIDKPASEKATRARLDTLTAILTEYEATATTLGSAESNVGQPAVYSSGSAGTIVTPVLALPPGDINLGAYDRWSQKHQNPPAPANMTVINTGLVLQGFTRVPAVKTMLGQLPAAALLASNNGINGVWIDSDGTTEAGTPLQVVVDAWKNPIIYVPSGGMQNISVTRGSSTVSVTVIAADGRPFWASAGQDGIMTNGDDNLYSTTVVYK